jgi:hypothetical protein
VTTLAARSGRASTLRLPKVDTRLVVGLLLVALSVLGGLRLAATSDQTVAVYAAAHDLPADHVLTATDFRITRIHASDETLAGLVTATKGSPPVHRVLRFPLAEGGLVATSTLGGVASRAQVVDVVHADGLFGQREGELTALTVSVKPDDVVFVAFAVRNGDVDVVRANGTAHTSRSRFDVSELP